MRVRHARSRAGGDRSERCSSNHSHAAPGTTPPRLTVSSLSTHPLCESDAQDWARRTTQYGAAPPHARAGDTQARRGREAPGRGQDDRKCSCTSRSPSRPRIAGEPVRRTKADDTKRLKALEKENVRLKKLLAEAELDTSMLKELARELYPEEFPREACEQAGKYDPRPVVIWLQGLSRRGVILGVTLGSSPGQACALHSLVPGASNPKRIYTVET